MIDASEVYQATKDAVIDAHRTIDHPLVIPLPPFRAERTLSDGETDAAHVTGIRYDSTRQEWVFVCIVSDSLGGLYVSEHDELVGDLPGLPV